MKKFESDEYFFVIDSNQLDNVKSRFYGYAIIDEKIVEDCVAGNELDGTGVYVSVKASQDAITIRQDFLGSFGIYVYERDGYWAVSNSFWLLAEYIRKTGYTLTKNKDFVDHMLIPHIHCAAYSATPFYEINCVSRNANIFIKKKDRTYRFEYINYGENSVYSDSKEGLDILDMWFVKWTHIIKNLSLKTNNIFADLSGGFDSRMAFVPVLKAGLSTKDVSIRSYESDSYKGFIDDYRIASEIGKYFGFELNDRSNMDLNIENYGLNDALTISYYTKWLMHDQLYFYRYCPSWKEPHYYISGHGGESVRQYWSGNDYSCDTMLETWKKVAWRFSPKLEKRLSNALDKIYKQTLKEIDAYYEGKTHIADKGVDLFRDTYCRYHFGKQNIESLSGNSIILQPLLDPMIQKLTLRGKGINDDNFLMALILDRYCKKLLDFPFEGDRSISKDTLLYVQNIDNSYPFNVQEVKTSFGGSMPTNMRNNIHEGCTRSVIEDNDVSVESIDAYLRKVFISKKVRSTFRNLYSDEIRRCADNIYKRTKHYPLQLGYIIIAVVLMEDLFFGNIGDVDIQTILDSYIDTGKDMGINVQEHRIDIINAARRFIRRAWHKVIYTFRIKGD